MWPDGQSSRVERLPFFGPLGRAIASTDARQILQCLGADRVKSARSAERFDPTAPASGIGPVGTLPPRRREPRFALA